MHDKNVRNLENKILWDACKSLNRTNKQNSITKDIKFDDRKQSRQSLCYILSMSGIQDGCKKVVYGRSTVFKQIIPYTKPYCKLNRAKD